MRRLRIILLCLLVPLPIGCSASQKIGHVTARDLSADRHLSMKLIPSDDNLTQTDPGKKLDQILDTQSVDLH